MPHDNGAFWTCSTWFIFPQCSSELNSNMHQQWNGILFVIKAARKLDNFLPGQLSHSSLIWKWELFEVCCLAGPKLWLSSANHRKNGTLTFPIAAHVWTGVCVIKESCAIATDQCPASTRITFEAFLNHIYFRLQNLKFTYAEINCKLMGERCDHLTKKVARPLELGTNVFSISSLFPVAPIFAFSLNYFLLFSFIGPDFNPSLYRLKKFGKKQRIKDSTTTCFSSTGVCKSMHRLSVILGQQIMAVGVNQVVTPHDEQPLCVAARRKRTTHRIVFLQTLPMVTRLWRAPQLTQTATFRA